MDNSLYNQLDKSNVYCYNCFKEGNIVELSIHNSLQYCLPCRDHNIRTKFRLQFDKAINEWRAYRGITFGNKSQSEINRCIYQIQKKNKTGWCSREAIYKKNCTENNCIRQQNAAKNGNKKQGVITQLARGLHPSQNLKLQSKKVLLMQLRKVGVNISLEDLSNKEYLHYFELIDLKIDGNKVTYEDSIIYNERCGSIGLYGINILDGLRYALNAGKSNNLGNEIRKFWRIISNPQKQDMNYDYGRWYSIANNYHNFEVIILCVDVPEKEALLAEMSWSLQNDANFKYNIDSFGNKRIKCNTHGYWM